MEHNKVLDHSVLEYKVMEYIKFSKHDQPCYICGKSGKLEYGELLEHISNHVHGDFKCGHCFKYLRRITLRDMAFHVNDCRQNTDSENERNRRQSYIDDHMVDLPLVNWKRGLLNDADEIAYRNWAEEQVEQVREHQKVNPERRLFIPKIEMTLTRKISAAAKRQIKKMLNCEVIYESLWECPPVRIDLKHATKLYHLNGYDDDCKGLYQEVLEKNHKLKNRDRIKQEDPTENE